MGQWFRIKCCLKIYFSIKIGNWLYRLTVHIGLFNFGRGSFGEHFLWHYLCHRFRELFEYIMDFCNTLINKVDVYQEEHFCAFRVCNKTA